MIFDTNEFSADVARQVALMLEQSIGDDVLDVKEAAALLKFHPTTVSQWAKDGTLPGKKLGDSWRFRRSTLLNFITDNAQVRERQTLALASD